MVDWSAVLQSVLEYVLPILAVALVGYVVAAIRALLPQVRAWLVAKAGAEQVALAEAVVYRLVDAAEQMGLVEELKKAGKEKKAWVMAEAKRELYEHGISIDIDRLESLVEAAVYAANYDKRQPPVEPRVIGAG